MSKKNQQKKKGRGAGGSVSAAQKQVAPAAPSAVAHHAAAPAPAAKVEAAAAEAHHHDAGDHGHGHHHHAPAPAATTLLGQYGLMLAVFAAFLGISLLPFVFVPSLRSDAYVVVFVALITFGFVLAACALDWATERMGSKH